MWKRVHLYFMTLIQQFNVLYTELSETAIASPLKECSYGVRSAEVSWEPLRGYLKLTKKLQTALNAIHVIPK